MAAESTYKQGHQPVVTQAHAIRTAERDAAFVLPHLQPHFRILDVGCGPGSITSSFAKYVPRGSVTGVDLSAEAIAQARELLGDAAGNVAFVTGNVVDGLAFPNGSFDVVFCNQTLLHIPEPVRAMREMRRLCRKGGFVACRESDMPFRFYPLLPGLSLWMKYLYTIVWSPRSQDPESVKANPAPQNPPHGPEYGGGSLLHVWAREAGFEPLKMRKGGSVTVEDPGWFAKSMGDRVRDVAGENFKEVGASDEDVQLMINDLEAWGKHRDAWMGIMQIEITCFV